MAIKTKFQETEFGVADTIRVHHSFKAGGKTPQTTVNVTALPGPEEPADNPGETPEIPGSPVGI